MIFAGVHSIVASNADDIFSRHPSHSIKYHYFKRHTLLRPIKMWHFFRGGTLSPSGVHLQLNPINSEETFLSRPGGAPAPSATHGYAYVLAHMKVKNYQHENMKRWYSKHCFMFALLWHFGFRVFFRTPIALVTFWEWIKEYKKTRILVTI